MVEARHRQRNSIHAYVDQNRVGDHICYYSDLRKMKSHYPKWQLTHGLRDIIEEIIVAWRARLMPG